MYQIRWIMIPVSKLMAPSLIGWVLNACGSARESDNASHARWLYHYMSLMFLLLLHQLLFSLSLVFFISTKESESCLWAWVLSRSSGHRSKLGYQSSTQEFPKKIIGASLAADAADGGGGGDGDGDGDDEGDAATGHWLRSQSTRSVNTIRTSALKVVRLVRDHPGSMIRRDDLFASNFLRRVSLSLSLSCFTRIGW